MLQPLKSFLNSNVLITKRVASIYPLSLVKTTTTTTTTTSTTTPATTAAATTADPITTADPTTTAGPANLVKASYYDNMMVSKISDAMNQPNYPDSPSKVYWLNSLEAPRDDGDYYLLRLQTLFVSQQTGDHRFAVFCDDKCMVYFSLTSSENNKTQLIDMPYYTSYRSWSQ